MILHVFVLWVLKEILDQNGGIFLLKIDEMEAIVILIWVLCLEHEVLIVDAPLAHLAYLKFIFESDRNKAIFAIIKMGIGWPKRKDS